MTSKLYKVNEVFYSLQGEGARAGSANVFVRFSGCNLKCTEEEMGFDCDTFHMPHETYTACALVNLIAGLTGGVDPVNIIFTGGEPLLQLDVPLLRAVRRAFSGCYIALETNGTQPLSLTAKRMIDWISVSPKPGAALVLREANELRYVLRPGQDAEPLELARHFSAKHFYVSPAFEGDEMREEALQQCIEFVRKHPRWRMSVQQHKGWGIL